jgi:hypothetical protein
VTDYDVGYGKPPKHSQFKKGVCPNPRGRGRRGDLQFREILHKVLNTRVEFRERGKAKKASRIELYVRRLAAAAAKGDPGSAAMLLKVRAHAIKHWETGPRIIQIINALPERDLPLGRRADPE